MSEAIKPEVIDQLAEKLKGYFPSVVDFDRMKAELANPERYKVNPEQKFSISMAVRGLMARNSNTVINPKTVEADINYAVKALTTGSTTGSYLVPTIQASEIIDILAQSSVFRTANPTVWPMVGIEKLNVPTATATPTAEWLGENTSQSATDPTLGQLAFDLKSLRALTAVPNELLATSVPAVDTLVSRLIGVAFGEKEDVTFTSTSTTSGGFTSIYAASSTTTSLVGGSANGGDLAYSDLLTILSNAYTYKAKPPFAWFMHPRTFFQRVYGMIDLQSRPIVAPNAQSPINFGLFGWPVFISANFPVDQTNGSGTSQSYIAFTNPRYVHIAEPGGVEIAVSADFYFSSNQTAIRGVHRMDAGFAPPAGVVLLKGIN